MNALKPVNVAELRRMRAAREKIACLTCYDASFAMLEDRAGVDVILVGDSLGMVIQGGTTTTPVTVPDIASHSRCVASTEGRRGGQGDVRPVSTRGWPCHVKTTTR